MGDSSQIVKIVAFVNSISAFLLIGCQIALYFVGYDLGYYFVTDTAVINASIGVWGGLIIFMASAMFMSDKGSKNEKAAMAVLAAVIGIVILGVFSNELNYIGSVCKGLLFNICDLYAVEALLVAGGVISTLASGFLAFTAFQAN